MMRSESITLGKKTDLSRSLRYLYVNLFMLVVPEASSSLYRAHPDCMTLIWASPGLWPRMFGGVGFQEHQ